MDLAEVGADPFSDVSKHVFGWSIDTISLYKNTLKTRTFPPSFPSLWLLSKLFYESLISRLLFSDQSAAALNYSPQTQALPFNGQILRRQIGREDSGSLGGVPSERAILAQRNAVSWLFCLRSLSPLVNCRKAHMSYTLFGM